MKFDVEFIINRFPIKLQHRAVQLAADHGLGEVLFPTDHNITQTKLQHLRCVCTNTHLFSLYTQTQCVNTFLLVVSEDENLSVHFQNKVFVPQNVQQRFREEPRAEGGSPAHLVGHIQTSTLPDLWATRDGQNYHAGGSHKTGDVIVSFWFTYRDGPRDVCCRLC